MATIHFTGAPQSVLYKSKLFQIEHGIMLLPTKKKKEKEIVAALLISFCLFN